jgi:hypothetical protein
VETLLDLVGKMMVEGYGRLHPEVIKELKDEISGTAWAATSGIKRRLPSAYLRYHASIITQDSKPAHTRIPRRNTEHLPSILWMFTCSSSRRCWRGYSTSLWHHMGHYFLRYRFPSILAFVQVTSLSYSYSDNRFRQVLRLTSAEMLE